MPEGSNIISKKDIHLFGEKQRILLRANEFICLRPHYNLREYISNYNITFPTKTLMPDSFTVMPCGCPSFAVSVDSRNLSVSLEGPATKPYIVGSEVNQLKMLVTIEFKPAGLYALTGINQSELIDKTISFDTVNSTLSKLMSEAVEKAASIYELLTNLDSLLLANMDTACHPQLRQALHNIIDCKGSETIKNLSDDIHYSERQLNRIFRQCVGLSTKSFSRLVRINNAFRLLKKPHNSLTLVSDLTGFHDLPHFIRDFKLVCGITPQEYRNNMSDFYNNFTKF